MTNHGIEGHESFTHHYVYWTQKRGIQRSELDWCHWGEDFTVRISPELDETEMHVGDLWEANNGDNTVLFAVYGGRIPCSRAA